jgi:hypothetical protein
MTNDPNAETIRLPRHPQRAALPLSTRVLVACLLVTSAVHAVLAETPSPRARARSAAIEAEQRRAPLEQARVGVTTVERIR